MIVTGAGGTPLAVRRAGSGRPTLFVHGTGAEGGRWGAVQADLATDRLAISYDRRGRGGSGDGAVPYRIDDEVEDLLAVARSAGEESDVVAHSYGALVALLALRRDPARFRRVVLYEPPLAAPDGPGFIDTAAVAALETTFARDGAEAGLLRFLAEFVRSTPAEIAALRAMPNWGERVRSAPTIVRELLAVAGVPFDAPALAEVVTPVLVLQGGDSPPPFQAGAPALAAALGNADLRVLPGQRHRAMDDDPALMVTALRAWLDDGASAARALLRWLELAVRRVDYGAVRSLLPPDGLYFGSRGAVMHGYEEMHEKQFRHVWPVITDFTIEPDSIVAGGEGDHAWAANLFRTGLRGSSVMRQGRMTWLFGRRHGHWRILHSHDSLFPASPGGD